MDINEIAHKFGVSVNGSAYYSDCISEWRNIYEGNPKWKIAKKGGLFSRGDRELLRLNMAKVLCDSLSALTFSEQCEIVLDNEDYQKYVDSALNSNGFWKQLPELLCHAYAMGGCVLKCYLENGNPKIDYIIADRFIPTIYNGRGINEGINFCPFINDKCRNDCVFNGRSVSTADGLADCRIAIAVASSDELCDIIIKKTQDNVSGK